MLENSAQNSRNLTVDSSDNLTLSSVNFTSNANPQMTEKSLFMELVSLNDYALIIYSSILGLAIVIAVARSLGFFSYCMSASTKLHNAMFSKIVFSPMLFFNNNPSGRVLNRFSKDIGSVDETLPITMIDTVQVRVNIYLFIKISNNYFCSEKGTISNDVFKYPLHILVLFCNYGLFTDVT